MAISFPVCNYGLGLIKSRDLDFVHCLCMLWKQTISTHVKQSSSKKIYCNLFLCDSDRVTSCFRFVATNKVKLVDQLTYMGRSHGGGDNFSAKGNICENCNFFSQIKYFFTKQLLSIINTICKKNIQKL